MSSIGKAFINMETAAFCGQLSMILKSGISSYEGIEIMLEDCETAEDRAILESVSAKLQETMSLAEALRSTGIMPDYMIRMVELGEETGKLDEVMTHLASHYEREDSITRSIRSSLTYPIVMVSMMLVIIIVMLVKVMPIFESVFRQLGGEMSGAGKALVAAGSALGRYSAVIVILLAILAAFAVWAGRSAKGRKTAVDLFMKFRFAREFNRLTSLSRLSSGLALALGSGSSPERALELATELVSDACVSKKLEACKDAVLNGEDLTDALREEGLLTGLDARLAQVGRKTGSLDQSMAKIADHSRKELDEKLESMLAVLEPAIVVILSIIVGVILLSAIIPLTAIMSAM